MTSLEILTIVFGTFLRLALPFIITLFAALVLRWFDERWRRESMQDVVKAAGLQAGSGQVTCWDVFNCPPERRRSCRAYMNPDAPCWETFSVQGRLQQACRRCPLRAFRLSAASA